MDYYDNEKNVKKYIKMYHNYDGGEIIAVLTKYLKKNSTILELGMGPGKDFAILGESYCVTGSDASKVFLDKYKQQFPESDLLKLDAISIDTERRFDCIFSNKVLHHLTKEELRQSLFRQRSVLNKGGLVCHTFWKGNWEEVKNGLRSVYYTEEDLKQLFLTEYDILESGIYSESDNNDSIYLIARVKQM